MSSGNVIRRAVLFAAIGLTLSGCATIKGIHDAQMDSTANVDRSNRLIDDAISAPTASAPRVRVFEEQYVATESVELAKADDPALACSMPYNSGRGGRTLQEIGQDISEHCGIPVRVTPDAIAMLNGVYDRALSAAGSGTQAAQTTQPPPAAGGPTSLPPGMIAPPPAAGALATTFGLGNSPAENRGSRISILWDGKLRGFLDAISARTGLNWRVSGGAISFYYLETRTFQILGIPSDTTLASDISASSDATTGVSGGSGTGGGGAGGGGGSQGIGGGSSTSQKMAVAVAATPSKDMLGVVQSMLTPGVGRVAATFGTITVTDTPDRLGPIGDFIAGRNQANTMQARFTVQVLSVQANRGSEAALNTNFIYQNLAKNYKVTIANAFQADPAATSSAVNILDGNSKWAGSSAVFDLLSSVAKVSTVYDEPFSTLNMHAVSIKNIKSDMFVISTRTTQIGTVTGGTDTTIEQALQTVGLNMQLIPSISPKGDEVYMQFSLGLSDASPLTPVTVGQSFAQQTHTTSGDVTQSVKLRSGQTLMLMGYRQAGASLNQNGTGDEHFQLLGGGQSGNKTGRYLVVLITPNIQS